MTTWQQARAHGGGFIAGLIQTGTHPGVFYARSDVAGVFRSDDGARSWRVCNAGMSGVHAHDVRSFAVSPHDAAILFRGSGSVRGGEFFGTIHRSTDGGDSWHPVTTAIDFYGNGELRQYGEVIAVDPFDPNRVIAAGYTRGLWISADLGLTWTYAGLRDERICTVAFHPARRGVIYIGTVGSFDADPLFVQQQYDTIRPNPARLYRSSDGGLTWNVLHEGVDFAELAFDAGDPDVIHAACLADGVLRSIDGGETWERRAPGLSRYRIGTVTVDPHRPGVVYAAAETFPSHDSDVPPIGLYRSDDGGGTWTLVRWYTEADLRNYPAYMSLPYAGWAIAKVRVDRHDPDRLTISNWYGVAVSTDGGRTWDAHGFAGLENICVEHVLAHPTDSSTFYAVAADHNPLISTDGGRTFDSTPRPTVPQPQPDSTAIAVSPHDRDVLLYGVKGSGIGSIVRAGGDGRDPRVVWRGTGEPDTAPSRLMFQSRAAAVSVQALAADPHVPGRFYAYIDGLIACGAGVMRSDDWGETWTHTANPFPAAIARVPVQREWIENELLSVVIAQTKNVCGTNQLMAVDAVTPGVLVVGEWTEGIFRTRDGGESWTRIGGALPFGRDRASVLVGLRADPVNAGVLYAGFIREGVWRTRDGGNVWEKVFPAHDRPFNASAIAVGGARGEVIAVACEPLYYSPAPSAVWVSRDGGMTWANLTDPALGSVRWKSLALTPDGGRLVAAACGNSFFTLDLKATV